MSSVEKEDAVYVDACAVCCRRRDNVRVDVGEVEPEAAVSREGFAAE
jgi:hypothetical protein